MVKKILCILLTRNDRKGDLKLRIITVSGSGSALWAKSKIKKTEKV